MFDLQWVIDPACAMYNMVPITTDVDVCNLLFYAIKYHDFDIFENLPHPQDIVCTMRFMYDDDDDGETNMIKRKGCCISKLLRHRHFAVWDDTYGVNDTLFDCCWVNDTGRMRDHTSCQGYTRIVMGISIFQYLVFYYRGQYQEQERFINILQQYLLLSSTYPHPYGWIRPSATSRDIAFASQSVEVNKIHQQANQGCELCHVNKSDLQNSESDDDYLNSSKFPYIKQYFSPTSAGNDLSDILQTEQLTDQHQQRFNRYHSTWEVLQTMKKLLGGAIDSEVGGDDPNDHDVSIYQPLYGYLSVSPSLLDSTTCHRYDHNNTAMVNAAIISNSYFPYHLLTHLQAVSCGKDGYIAPYMTTQPTSIATAHPMLHPYLASLHVSNLHEMYQSQDGRYWYERLLNGISSSNTLEVECLLLMGIQTSVTAYTAGMVDGMMVDPCGGDHDQVVYGVPPTLCHQLNIEQSCNHKHDDWIETTSSRCSDEYTPIMVHHITHLIKKWIDSRRGTSVLHLINTTNITRFETMLRLLTHYGADITLQDWHNRNLLHRMFLRSIRPLDVVDVIIAELHHAIGCRLKMILRYLLRQVVTSGNHPIFHPYHLPIEQHRGIINDCVRYILNRYDSSGFHLLHYVTRKTSQHSLDIMKCLLYRYQLDPTCRVKHVGYRRCVDGFTPLHFLSLVGDSSDSDHAITVMLDNFIMYLCQSHPNDDTDEGYVER